MEIPIEEIEAIVSYIEADLEMGVQLCQDWKPNTEKVRKWLGAITTLAPDACAVCGDPLYRNYCINDGCANYIHTRR